MKMNPLSLASIAILLGSAVYSGLSIGLALPGAAIFSLVVAAPYSFLLRLSGASVLALPLIGASVGLAGVLLVQLLSGGTPFDLGYYLFGPALGLCVVSFIASLLLLLTPKLRARLFTAR